MALIPRTVHLTLFSIILYHIIFVSYYTEPNRLYNYTGISVIQSRKTSQASSHGQLFVSLCSTVRASVPSLRVQTSGTTQPAMTLFHMKMPGSNASKIKFTWPRSILVSIVSA